MIAIASQCSHPRPWAIISNNCFNQVRCYGSLFSFHFFFFFNITSIRPGCWLQAEPILVCDWHFWYPRQSCNHRFARLRSLRYTNGMESKIRHHGCLWCEVLVKPAPPPPPPHFVPKKNSRWTWILIFGLQRDSTCHPAHGLSLFRRQVPGSHLCRFQHHHRHRDWYESEYHFCLLPILETGHGWSPDRPANQRHPYFGHQKTLDRHRQQLRLVDLVKEKSTGCQ